MAGNDAVDQLTVQRIRQYLQTTPTVYLPTHDADATKRLAEHTIVSLPDASRSSEQ